MRLLQVSLTNYGAFHDQHTFELSRRGLVLIRGENLDEPRMNSNGSGKSTLVESIDWCLFGAVPRGDSVDSIVTTGRSNCSVTVELEDDDGICVRVTRAREGSKTTLQLYYDGEDVTSLDSRETQRYIEWHLGVDRQVFHATVLFAQTDMFQFADATDSERIAILTKILRLEEVDAWAESAKGLRNEVQQVKTKAEQQVSSLVGQLQTLRTFDATKQQAEWEAQRQAQFEQADERVKQFTAEGERLKGMLGNVNELRRQLNELRRPEPPASLDAAGAEVQRARTALEQAQKLVWERREAVSHAERLCKLGDVCPTCEQAIPMGRQAEADQYACEAQDALKAAQDLYTNLGQVEMQASKHMEDCRAEYTRTLAECESRMAEMRGKISMHEGLQGQWDRNQAQLEHAIVSRRALHEQVNPFTAQIEQVERQRIHLQQALDAAEAEVESAGRSLQCYEFWVDACSAKGLKSYVLDSRLQEMTDAANHWVKLLTGGTIWIRLETTTPTKAGAARNKFNVRVFRQEPDGAVTERNYRSWSGGERQRVSLGIDFGLSRLIAQRARKPYDTLILDEIFRHLDGAGREAVMEMLQALRQEKQTILVVDHDAEFQSMFERRVTVRKHQGSATIIEEDHEDRDGSVCDRDVGAAAGRQPADAEKPGGTTRRRGGTRRPAADKRAGTDEL